MKKAKGPPAVMPVKEPQWIAQQSTATTTAHPGATQSGVPDNPARGQDWHAEDDQGVKRSLDALEDMADQLNGVVLEKSTNGHSSYVTHSARDAYRQVRERSEMLRKSLTGLQRFLVTI